jgi:hypothetical protein
MRRPRKPGRAPRAELNQSSRPHKVNERSMSGEHIRIERISQPQAEAEEAALEVGEVPEETRRANVSCDHTNSWRDGGGWLL